MKAFIGLGSNLASLQRNRLSNLEAAAKLLAGLPETCALRASPVYQNPALVPEGAPLEWRTPFLNAVVEIDWSSGPHELFQALKKIEVEVGRSPAPRWAPRVIDLDLLLFGDLTLQEPALKIPHPDFEKREFVLRPLKDLYPSALKQARALKNHLPLWMGILNVTPDSFSDGGKLLDTDSFSRKLDLFDSAGIQVLDLGGESTRPGASAVDPKEEWSRIENKLGFIRSRYEGQIFRPLLSVDTRRAQVAARAIENGADWINDVGALSDSDMARVIGASSCHYVLMHSLTVPPNRKDVLSNDRDPIEQLRTWALTKIEMLQHHGVECDRIIFDPGIGFGKTPHQSIEILKRIEELYELPVRLLVGHSRKSFMDIWNTPVASQATATPRDWADRDAESIGVSLRLASSGVDIIRVHEAHLHARAWNAFNEVTSK